MSVATDDGWVLTETVDADIDRLMRWFPDKNSVNIWGGPRFRHPFTRHSFAEDMHWGRMASFSLYNPDAVFAAFGQAYERYDRINLARLIVSPELRGQRIGTRLVEMIMGITRTMFDCEEFSLFVYRDNIPAYRCYTALGFELTDYPTDMPLGDVCYYLTRPVN